MSEELIAALKRERAMYVAAGKDERAAEVDAELARLGVKARAVAAVDTETAAAVAPKETAAPRRKK